MEFQYKIQKFQTEAVQAVIDVFQGQEAAKNRDNERFSHDVGKVVPKNDRLISVFSDKENAGAEILDVGIKNRSILDSVKLLENIQQVQQRNNIMLSSQLVHDLSNVELDVEMETGTGKTYVYIKTMFELHKHYGWKKFIVVVPSVAIREGVKKSFDSMEQHFMEQYHHKVRCFIYNSSNLNQLDAFATDNGINVMIINTQAFATSLKEGGRSEAARIIYSERDSFNSRRPIDVIASVNPIIIMDEPQKMGGKVTLEALKHFKPLFVLNYSATHAKQHNLVYVLDAYEAFLQRIVKKIEVKGLEVRNRRAQDGYAYFESLVLSADKQPFVRLGIEVKQGSKIRRKILKLAQGDNLYTASNGLQQYSKCYIESIDAEQGRVALGGLNVTLKIGEACGNVSELDERRIQIRETIESHFAKEHDLFQHGIKCLSLFFIDEVAKYRVYDEEGQEQLGIYGKIFEEEYLDVWNEYRSLFQDETGYQEYLLTKCADSHAAHRGYFSIDKKTGHSIDSKTDREKNSDDISAYDLILKNKERLLSFEEPTRFIFSHSALREGWDNPNIFQICTLKQSDSTTSKRQEVGRGMRLCVNQQGRRMDNDTVAGDVHDLNLLTVIASESYADFVDNLQKDIKMSLYDRPTAASEEYFIGKMVKIGEEYHKIDDKEARAIHNYLVRNNYIDDNDKLMEEYKVAVKEGTLAPIKEELQPMQDGINKLIQGIFDEKVLDELVSEKQDKKIDSNPKTENFEKAEFKELWNKINHKYAYTVEFDSDELIAKSVKAINEELNITKVVYVVTTGEQGKDMLVHDKSMDYNAKKQRTKILDNALACKVPYDVVGNIARGAVITRRSTAKILQGIYPEKFAMFKVNPEEFIAKCTRIIMEQKATMVVEHISYKLTDGDFDTEIFTVKKTMLDKNKVFEGKKHVLKYVVTDGIAAKSTERKFAEELDAANDVAVYAKLPRGFYIPTPMGNYSPDWAIAFKKGTVKHIFFVAETKGSLDSEQLRKIEGAKTNCAKILFNKLKLAQEVRYHVVTNYDDLMNAMGEIKD